MTKQKLVKRPDYLEWLKGWREKQVIKVVAGVRRCGKSTLFKLYIDWLLETGVSPKQIIYINLEEIEYKNLLNYRELYDCIKARLYKDGYTYVFIDEVQNCKDYEKAVDSLLVKDNVDVYIGLVNLPHFYQGDMSKFQCFRFRLRNMLILKVLKKKTYHLPFKPICALVHSLLPLS